MEIVPAPWILVTALMLLNAKPQETKVYYKCGAVLDSAEKGLILSPGFPNNYLPGSHCVWQIFIPAGSQLILETLDFDIFESDDFTINSPPSGLKRSSTYNTPNEENLYTKTSLFDELQSSNITPTTVINHNEVGGHIRDISSKRWDKAEQEIKPLSNSQSLTNAQDLEGQAGSSTIQKEATFVTLKRVAEQDSVNAIEPIIAVTARMLEQFEYWQPSSEDATALSMGADGDNATSQPSGQDICLYDVLYISDLVTFSSRFCGSNSPLNKTLLFGSPVEMMEVIMEFISTTDRGRGFAILFAYQNQSIMTSMGVQERRGGDNVMLMAVGAASISFTFVLLLALCLSYRQRFCFKRDEEPEQTTQQLSQSATMEVGEIRLAVPGKDTHSWELEVTNQEEAADLSLQVIPSFSTLTDSQSDEVFVISAENKSESFPCTNFPLQERTLRRSVTSPASVSEWLNLDYSNMDLGLQMKWHARTSCGSFAKLDNGGNVKSNQDNSRRAGSDVPMEGTTNRLYSDSLTSNASYPLTRSAQLQRKLPFCNLKKSHPSIGVNNCTNCLHSSTIRNTYIWDNNLNLKTSPECLPSPNCNTANGIQPKELSTDMDFPKTVFTICEVVEDKKPLVLDDQLSPSQDSLSSEKEENFITCTTHKPSVKPTKPLYNLNPWMKSTECSRYCYTQDTASISIPPIVNTNVQEFRGDTNTSSLQMDLFAE
ncbi:hypothetical protein GDO86_001959 [Hymenochirus boettgeri]|uniref:CUB domain-containing protein n=1 Tax=Hymenochirus boettgeri TaxID=247094 RepID=A0A8T2KJ63_9PIPI|nr:hypothetical protein GDO86_001959 [Hymenochirus boettgeri]